MWKSLKPGEKVHAGNTLRYRSNLQYLTPSPNKIYDVVKTDLHYFEVEPRTDKGDTSDPDRRVIKYMDVGYHITLEIWAGNDPFIYEY